MTDQESTRVEQSSSRTALSAGMLRYMAWKEKDPAFQGPDYLAGLFMPPNVKTVLFFPFLRRLLRKRFVGGYEYVLARTRFFDDLFLRALQDRVPQIVVLGAGFDTRAIRFAESNKGTRIFELDAPPTQQEKQQLLEKHQGAVPVQLTFVPINFQKQELGVVLADAGYDTSQETLFLWEGVTPYLTDEAVQDTLAFIADHSGKGSRVAFDYFLKEAFSGSADFYGAPETFAAVARDREPFQFGIEEGAIGSFLSDLGFDVIEHYSPQEFEDKYLRTENGELFGRMYGFASHVLTRKR